MKKTVRYISIGIVIIVVAFLLIYLIPKMTTFQRIPECISLQSPELKGASPIDFMEVNLKLENGIQIAQGDSKQNIYELSFEFLNEEITESLTLASEDMEFVRLCDVPLEGDNLYDTVVSNGKNGEMLYIYKEDSQEVDGRDRILTILLEDLKKNRYGIRYQVETDELPTVPLYLYVRQNFTNSGDNILEAELNVESDTSIAAMAWRKYSFAYASWAMHYPDIESLVVESELIAVVETTGPRNKYGQTGVKVVEAIHGCQTEEELSVYQTGSFSDSFKSEICDDPLLDMGKNYLIFARRNSNGTVTILGGPQGRFCYEDGKVGSLIYGVPRLRLLEYEDIISIDLKDVDYGKLLKQIENALETK